MTTEITEGMPQKAGVRPGDSIADEWREGQFGRFTWDNHVHNTEFMDLLNKTPENTYFPCDIEIKGARYKWQTKKSSDPSRWDDSRIIYESISKFSPSAQKLYPSSSPPIMSGTSIPMGNKPTMTKGITKEIMIRKLGEEFNHQLEINQILDSEEWTLFSTHVMGESLILTFVR